MSNDRNQNFLLLAAQNSKRMFERMFEQTGDKSAKYLAEKEGDKITRILADMLKR